MNKLLDIVAAIRKRHSLKDSDDVQVKGLSSIVAADGDPYKFTARITTDGVDRDHEVLLPSGCDATEFEKSGAVYWNHSYTDPVAVANKLTRGDNYIDGKGTFLKRPDDWVGEWFPDFVRAFVAQMAAAGKAVGVSVGFIPRESRPPTREDRGLFGSDCRRVISKWKMLEWSIAPVQSNPGAFVQAVGKSLAPGMVRALFPEVRTIVLPRMRRKTVRERIEEETENQIKIAVARRAGQLFV